MRLLTRTTEIIEFFPKSKVCFGKEGDLWFSPMKIAFFKGVVTRLLGYPIRVQPLPGGYLL